MNYRLETGTGKDVRLMSSTDVQCPKLYHHFNYVLARFPVGLAVWKASQPHEAVLLLFS